MPGADFSADTRVRDFLAPGQDELEITVEGSSSGSAVIFHVLETNYHRVNYFKENWAAIEKIMRENTESIDKINRAQILDDVLNLAKADLLDYGTALSMTEYLGKEDEFIPWSAASTALSYVSLMLEGDRSKGQQLQVELFFY